MAQPTLLPVFHLTEKDGLNSPYASTLVEDKERGLIWIGTQNGIWRYDGEGLLKVYPHFKKDQLALETYLATTLYLADSRGDVWFYDEHQGLKRLSHTTGEVDNFYVRGTGQDSSIRFNFVFYMGGMTEDRKGRIWANTTSHGLVRFDEKKGCFTPIKMPATFEPSGNTGKIYQDDEGWLWFSNTLKPVRYNPETGEIWHQKNNPAKWPIFELTSSVFFVDSRQKMWLAEYSNGYIYDLKNHEFQKLPELNNASGFAEDSLGRIWFGRYYFNFLTCYDPQTKRFQQYQSNKNDPDDLHVGSWVAFVHIDKRGVLWALDVENINAFNPTKHWQFQVFKADLYLGEKSLPNGEVSDVFPASDGRYYISYWMKNGGIVVLDSNFQVQEKWSWDKRENQHRLAFWNSVEDNEGNIWMAHQGGWFLIYNLKSRRLRHLHCPEFKGSSPQRSMKDSQGNLWWGLWRAKGLTKWDCRTHKFTNYPLAPADYGMVHKIIEDGPDLLWLATEKGIMKFDRKTGQRLRTLPPPNYQSNDRLNQMAIGLVKINDSTLVGGSMAGIYEFNLKTEQFKLIHFIDVETVPRALSDMVLDGEGNIYYGYLGGMVRFHPVKRQLTVTPISEQVGFPFQPRFYPNPLPNGRLAFGANDRFLTLDIAALEDETPVPIPRVTLFMVDSDSFILGRDIEKPIRLQHHENYFSLNFSSFAQPNKSVYYSYRLRGLRDEWGQLSQVSFARFTNVPPGTYFFELRASYSNGSPSEISFFPIEIRPPFWHTWWFITLAAALFFGLIWLLFQNRLRQRLEKEAIRLRIARDLHDEVGSTLTTISILSESALRNVEADLERTRLTGIGEKARTALSSMSDIVWAVNPQNDSMEKVVERMTRFASETLENAGISPVFDIEKAIYTIQLHMEKRKDFYLFFKEATTNVAKHSGASKAVFTLKKEGGQLVFELRDDGIGLPEAPENSLGGNGLKNMAARAEALGADFLIKNGESSGVFVRLVLPVAL